MSEYELPPQRDFAGSLSRLADPAQPLVATPIGQLSGPSRADVALWRDVWPTIPVERRRWIAQQMSELTDVDFAVHFDPLFEVVLDDTDPEVRIAAIEGLWESNEVRLMGRYVDFLANDADAGVRGRAATALAPYIMMIEMEELAPELGQQAVRVLLDAASDESEDIDVRRRATEAVGFVDTSETRALIETYLDAPEGDLVAGALIAAGRSGLKRWQPTVLVYLSSPDPILRFAATHAAGDLGARSAVPLLVPLAEGEDGDVQLEAIWALGEIGGRQARRALENLATEADDDDVQDAIDDALSILSLSEGELDFTALAVDPTDSRLRPVSTAAELDIGPDEVEALDDDDVDEADDEDWDDWEDDEVDDDVEPLDL